MGATKHGTRSAGRRDRGATRGGDFALRSWRGTSDTRNLRGKVVLISFGYTFCPDICPTNLALIANALKMLASGGWIIPQLNGYKYFERKYPGGHPAAMLGDLARLPAGEFGDRDPRKAAVIKP
jgi:hypothetical protein